MASQIEASLTVSPRSGYWFLGSSDDDRGTSHRGRATPSRRSVAGETPPPVPEPLPDTDLVARIRTNDAEAFRLLYISLYRGAWETAFAYLRTDAAAEDVVHDVFLQIWESRTRWQVHGSVRAYVLSAIRHKALNVARHERVIHRDAERDTAVGSAGVLGVPSPSPQESVEASDLQHALERAIAPLPPLRREVITLRWRQGLSITEIAQVLGLSVNAVSIHLSRAREILLPLLRQSQTE